jgi:ADP-heptose:LPS heptosyltransferase
VADRLDLRVPDEVRDAARARHGRVDVTLHPGSSSPARNQPLGFWLDVASRLRAVGVRIAWCAGYAEEGLHRTLLDETARTGEPLLAGGTVLELAALLSLARVHLGHDTGATHLAGALGLRVEAVFGPSDPAIWAPPGPHVRVWRASETRAGELADAVGAVLAG